MKNKNSIDGIVNQITDAIVDAATECVKTDMKHRTCHFSPYNKELDKYQVSEKTREAVKDRVARAIGTADADECRKNLRSMLENDIFSPYQIEANHFWNDAQSVGLIVVDGDKITGNAISLTRPIHHIGASGIYHDFIEPGLHPIQFTEAKYAGREIGRVYFEDSTLRGEKCHYGGIGPGHFHPSSLGGDTFTEADIFADKIIKVFDDSCKDKK